MKPPANPYALLVTCTACLLLVMVCGYALFVEHIPLELAYTWKVETLLAFIAKVTAIAVPLFTLLILVTNKVFDWFGVVQARASAQHALSLAAHAKMQADVNSDKINNQQQRLVTALNGPLSNAIASGIGSALEKYHETADVKQATQEAHTTLTKSITGTVQRALDPTQDRREAHDSTTSIPSSSSASGISGSVERHT